MLNSERQAILEVLEQEEQSRDGGAGLQNDANGIDGRSDLPRIVVTDRRLREVSFDSLCALRQANEPPILFVRSGELVHIVCDESGRYGIEAAEPAYLRGRMERTADYIRITRQGPQPVAPPNHVVNDILALEPGDWQVPHLEGIVEAPILRPNGTVLSTPGYDRLTKVIYVPAPNLYVPTIKEHPSHNDVLQARSLLNEALGEFPYADQASRANTIGLLLTPIVRIAIAGPVPLALLDAPQAGTGKSLLANVIALITTGVQAAMMAAPKDEEEWRKSITATLSAGTTIILYDNIQHPLQAASLAMAITSPQWKDRILGLSKTITVPQRATWIATGNNIRLGSDLPRRCYWIRLDAQTSQPWRRDGFRHPDLIPWVIERRGELLAALLTFARAWYASGKPKGPRLRVGSFENWAETISGILTHAQIPGFLSNLEELYELADSATPQWEGFLKGLRETYGENPFTVAELGKRLQSDEALKEHLPEELAGAWGSNEAASAGFKVKLGKALRSKLGTRLGGEGLHLARSGVETRGGQVRWTILAGMQGSQGSNLPTREIVFNARDGESTELTLQTCNPAKQPMDVGLELAAGSDKTLPQVWHSPNGSRKRTD